MGLNISGFGGEFRCRYVGQAIEIIFLGKGTKTSFVTWMFSEFRIYLNGDVSGLQLVITHF